MRRLAATVAAAAAVGAALTACAPASTDSGNKTKVDTSAADADADTAAASDEETTPPAPPEPDPDGTYSQSCDYLLGDFTSNSKKGFRFVADTKLNNTGNIGTVDEVKAIWFLAGGDKIKKTKTVKVKAGHHKRVGFIVPVGQDEIDRIQALGYDSKTCKVKVSLVDTFGKAR